MVRRRSGGSAPAADSTLTADAAPAAEARAGSAATAVAVAEPAAGVVADAEAAGEAVCGGAPADEACAGSAATAVAVAEPAAGAVDEALAGVVADAEAAGEAGEADSGGAPADEAGTAPAEEGEVHGAMPEAVTTAPAPEGAAEKADAAPGGKAEAFAKESVAGVVVGERATAAKAGSDRGDKGPAGPVGAGRQPASARRPVLLAAVVLALVAALAAAWTGWSWYGAAHDGDADFARARDTVLAAGEQAVQNMNTLNHNDLGHGLDVWEASTTGDLHSQLVQGRADFEKQVQLAQTDSTAKVLSGAVTELDTRAGKASVMVALRITVQAPKSKPSVKESRLVAELTRTAAGWKLSALGQAPMGDSAASGDGSSTGSTASPGTSASAAPAAPTTKPSTSGR